MYTSNWHRCAKFHLFLLTITHVTFFHHWYLSCQLLLYTANNKSNVAITWQHLMDATYNFAQLCKPFICIGVQNFILHFWWLRMLRHFISIIYQLYTVHMLQDEIFNQSHVTISAIVWQRLMRATWQFAQLCIALMYLGVQNYICLF